MDSEDEKFLDRLAEKAEDSAWRACMYRTSQNLSFLSLSLTRFWCHLTAWLIPDEKRIPLKAWQKEEWESLKSLLNGLMQYPDDDNKLDWHYDYSAVYRLERLRDSIQGFYSVSVFSCFVVLIELKYHTSHRGILTSPVDIRTATKTYGDNVIALLQTLRIYIRTVG